MAAATQLPAPGSDAGQSDSDDSGVVAVMARSFGRRPATWVSPEFLGNLRVLDWCAVARASGKDVDVLTVNDLAGLPSC